MVLTYQEAVHAGYLALVKYHSKCRHSRFRRPDPAEEARGGGRAVLEAVGYADLLAEIEILHFALETSLDRRDALTRVEGLFSGGPDTSCRTTWRAGDALFGVLPPSVECVEVPMADLRAALGGAKWNA